MQNQTSHKYTKDTELETEPEKETEKEKRIAPSTHPQPLAFQALTEESAESEPQHKKRRPRLPKLPLPKWWPYGLAGLGIAGAIALAFRPAPIAVDIGIVERGPLQVTIAAEGKTRVKERFVVAAPVAGRLERIALDVGDRVSAGDSLAQIDPLPLGTQVSAAQAKLQELQAQISGVETQRPKSQELIQAQARLQSAQAEQRAAAAEVARAEAQWEQAKRDRDRTAQLESQGAVSRRELEIAQTLENTRQRELEAARQQLAQSQQAVNAAAEDIPLLQDQQRDPDYLIGVYQAQIAAVEAELANLADEASRTAITAPEAGDVLRVIEGSARFVQAGDSLVEIGNAEDLELVIDVLSADAVKIQQNSKIIVQQWGGSDALEATVSTVEPAAFTEVSALGVEEQRVNIIGQFAEKDIPLGDGYRVEAEIVIWESEESVQVPVSALFRCQQAWCVFSIEGDRAQLQQVDIGQRNPFNAVVLSGLAPGESVILHPNERIEAGSRVSQR